jgi:hypothetical protein
MAQVALNWSIQHEVIPLVGFRSAKQARDSVGCLGWSLSKSDVEALDRVALPTSTLDSKRDSFVCVVQYLHILTVFSYLLLLLAGSKWRRMFFVSLFGIVMTVCRTLDTLGFGSVVRLD